MLFYDLLRYFGIIYQRHHHIGFHLDQLSSAPQGGAAKAMKCIYLEIIQ